MPTPATTRRRFLAQAGLALAASAAGCATAKDPAGPGIIDTHTHFYDPLRPQGIPWPSASETRLYRSVLPAEYMALARPLGIRSTVVVEASPWPEDNQWILDLAAHEPFLTGFIGNLNPGTDAFPALLERFARNPKFRGLRIGGDTLSAALSEGKVRNHLERLGGHGLVIDVLVGPERLPDVATVADKVRTVPFVVDHLANVPIGKPPHPNRWVSGMAACHYVDNVFMKFSGFVEGTGARGVNAPTTLEPYFPILDTTWRIFGEDRLLFGSNWPVSTEFATLSTVVDLARRFLEPRGAVAMNKVFHDNALKLYRPVFA